MEFKEAFMRYYVPLCNYANAQIYNDTEAEDLVQDVFLHLWKNNDSLTITTHIEPLLFTSVKNKVYEQGRARKAYAKALNSYSQNASTLSLIDDEMSRESTKYMSMERLSSLLRHLPPKCKNVFALHKLNGLTYAEIADKEGIAIKTVENHMLKALKILRTKNTPTG